MIDIATLVLATSSSASSAALVLTPDRTESADPELYADIVALHADMGLRYMVMLCDAQQISEHHRYDTLRQTGTEELNQNTTIFIGSWQVFVNNSIDALRRGEIHLPPSPISAKRVKRTVRDYPNWAGVMIDTRIDQPEQRVVFYADDLSIIEELDDTTVDVDEIDTMANNSVPLKWAITHLLEQ
ncbi:hypothetical protein ACIGKQ_17085 [Gordonia sp. NPDC062954]|uniref:hypothetical protein n=1 Tax=Gordonia sp. NPDC062954 TaxID=3364003 RepID=UPI0037C5EFCA